MKTMAETASTFILGRERARGAELFDADTLKIAETVDV